MFFLSLWRSEFLTYFIFLLFVILPFTFLSRQLCRQQILSIFVYLRAFISLSLLKDNFTGYRFLVGVFFLPVIQIFLDFWGQVRYNTYHCSSTGKILSTLTLPFPASFRIFFFFLFLTFCSLKIIYWSEKFGAFIMLDILWISWMYAWRINISLY